MRTLGVVILVAACGSSGPDVTATTTFDVMTVNGSGISPLDPLVGKTLDVEIILDGVQNVHEMPGACKSTTVGSYPVPSVRTAKGDTADLVTTQILDRLPDWDVRFELCPTGSQSTIVLESVINQLNLSFGCSGIPSTALRHDGTGNPEVTSFTATDCVAVILDVVNNRDFESHGFSITFATGPDHVP